MLDEGLDVLTGLWTGQPFTYTGTHYQITNAQFLPAPLQSPRIPIWTAAGWPRQRPFERAARWDGVFPFGRNGKLTPNDYQAISDVILAHRGTLEGFDIVCEGRTDGFDRSIDAAQITPYAQAGVTWWLEHATEGRDSLADMQARIQRGPPSR
jgi:Luciferase-like monooxygenase